MSLVKDWFGIAKPAIDKNLRVVQNNIDSLMCQLRLWVRTPRLLAWSGSGSAWTPPGLAGVSPLLPGPGIMQHQSFNMQEILGVSGGERQVMAQGDRSNLRIFGG